MRGSDRRLHLTNNYLYFLLDPNNDKVKYIGITTIPKERYSMQLRNVETIVSSPKYKWIERLAKKKQYPKMLLVAKFQDREDCIKVERQLIYEFSKRQKIYNGKHIYKPKREGLIQLSKLAL